MARRFFCYLTRWLFDSTVHIKKHVKKTAGTRTETL